MSARAALARRLASEDGFTMLFALAALFIGALLVAAAFSAANGDLAVTHRATVQQKAYYAAVAGVDRYQYQLTSSPEYWTKCPTLGTEAKPLPVTGAADEGYYVKTLGATGKTCESGKQATILETGGTAKGTFRILSTGTVKEGNTTVTRKVVATFSHPGFTKYVYESNYEVEDPVNFGLAPSVCEYYWAERVAKGLTTKCPPIEFAPEDKVNGSMHTNDAAEVCASGGSAPTFGRTSSDEIEMNGGHYAAGGCSNTPNIVGKYTEKAGSVLPPATDAELLEAAGLKYEGRTEIELKSGAPNTMLVSKPGEAAKTEPFPSNGVVYVENSKTVPCAVTSYTPFGSDTVNDTGCGNVYVHGKYTESLTIASADDVIVNGNLTTTTEPNGEPNGAATLGLIAENFVRVYHPVKESYEAGNRKPNTAAASNGKCTATSTVQISGIPKSGSKKVTGLASTEELAPGDAVSGTGIPTGDKIESIENGTTIVLKTAATSGNGSSSVTLTFTLPYVYFSGINKCVEETKAGYVFVELELLEYEKCESGSKYSSKGICKYEFTTGSCPSKATNLNSTEDPNHWGVLASPVIDAAILSTNHSWIVDNYKCGKQLGELTVWGSIAQFWRGPVGTAGGSGYIKNYNYDNRLADQQPPSFLAPTNATSWKVSRETAPPTGFTG